MPKKSDKKNNIPQNRSPDIIDVKPNERMNRSKLLNKPKNIITIIAKISKHEEMQENQVLSFRYL